VNQAFTDAYEENLVHFIRDLRKELGVKNLPFVIAETGMGGLAVKHGRALKLMKAQEAGAMRAEFKGTAAFVSTRPFWRTSEESPSGQGYHWNSNAETYCLMGEGMGLAMIDILDQPVEERIKLALENAQTKQERASLCRRLMKEAPNDYGLQGLCLAEIARQLGAKAFDDVLAGLNHQNAWVRRTARQLAIELPDSGTLKWVDYMSESDLRLSLELMGVLRARRNAKWLLRLNGPDAHKREGLRIAALRALHDLESKASMEAAARATSDKSQKIRKTAFAVLVSSNTPSATEALLMLAAKADRIQAHVEAMTHCFRRFAFGKIPEKARGQVLDKLISIARRPDEKRLALVELQKIPSLGTLATAHALSKDSDLREKASLAAIAIAEAMKLDDEKVKEKAVSLIEKVMKASKVKATRDAAERFIYKHRRPSLEDFDPELAP
jgi:hypothetical protein